MCCVRVVDGGVTVRARGSSVAYILRVVVHMTRVGIARVTVWVPIERARRTRTVRGRAKLQRVRWHDDGCGVCWEAMTASDVLVAPSCCGNTMHESCARKCRACPFCRARIKPLDEARRWRQR